MKNNTRIWIFLIAVIAIILFIKIMANPTKSNFENINSVEENLKLYKSITCGCCDVYSNYMNGNVNPKIDISNLQDISEIKKQYGIPEELQSCHTTIIEGYFVEGHIPLEAIEKLLEEKPNIKGIAMPGMPSGSPGMPGPKINPFTIYSINNDGTYNKFMEI